jgi:hypothetical protein
MVAQNIGFAIARYQIKGFAYSHRFKIKVNGKDFFLYIFYLFGRFGIKRKMR